MKKKAAAKSKGKGAAKKAKTPSRTKVKAQKTPDMVEIRKDITNLVGNEATQLAQAVVNAGKTGQLAQVKYLFEMAGLYPANGETRADKPQDNAMARTLLHRLGVPEEPVVMQEEEVPVWPLPAVRIGVKSETAAEEVGVDESSGDGSGHGDSDLQDGRSETETVNTGAHPVE